MELLIGFFGFFVLMSVVALIKFQGNPLFLFSLLLSAASLIWLVHLHRQEPVGSPTRRRSKRTRRPKRIAARFRARLRSTRR